MLICIVNLAIHAHGQASLTETPKPETKDALSASSSYSGAIVDEVIFPGVVNPADEERYKKLVAQQIGQPLERRKIRESFQALSATGRFADIQAEIEQKGEGKIRLIFGTQLNYFAGDVSVEGNGNAPTSGQIINASKFNLGELVTQEKFDYAIKAINQLMQQNGYYQSSTTYVETKSAALQQERIVFHITPGERARIGIIDVKGTKEYAPIEIQEMTKMRPGDTVTADRVSSALERLRKKFQKQDRWLTQVRISSQAYNAQRNAVDYTFEVTPGPKVKIQVEGFKLSNSQLKKLIPVFQENALDNDLLNEGRRNLLNYLESRGYFEAQVEYRRQRGTSDQTTVVYRINAGESHRLVKIEIEGSKYFSAELLRSHMQIQVVQRFLARGRYSQRLLSNDVSSLENLYRANGFNQIKITPSVEDDYQGKENEIAVVLNVDEGPQTKVAQVSIVGNEKVSEDVIRENISTSTGQPFSEFYINQDRDNVLNYYYNHGFPDATFEANAKPTPDTANSMDITFTIHEGNQVSVDQVLYSTLHYTKPFVVSREVDIKPQDPLSQLDLLNTQQKLYDLGIFNQVDVAVQNPDGKEAEKNVLINLKEARRYTFNYGLGLEFQTGQPSVGNNQPQGETGVSPRVSFGVTRLNFRGRDHTLSFKGNVGRLQQRALIGYEAPRWLNSPAWKLSLSFSYDNTIDVTTFTSERLEAAIRAIETINRASTFEYRFTYRRVQATNLPKNTSLVLLPLLSQPARVGAPGFSYILDKRDNALDPAKGNYTIVDGAVATRYFGSESDFSRMQVQNSTYYAFGKNPQRERKLIFARSTRIGVETPFGDTVYIRPDTPADATTIPLPELFLAGGGNSHRGFGLNQAGPRDLNSGFPLGGSGLFVNNLELRFPPVTLPYVGDNLSFAIFHDAGNIFTSAHDMFHNLTRWSQKDPESCLHDSATTPQCDFSYISHAVGVGVRYKTPIGPVRFDFGYNLNPPAFPSCQSTGAAGQAISPRCNALDESSPFFVPQHLGHFNVFFSIGQTF